MHNQKTKQGKKKFLIVSLLLNVGLLFYFKYCDFFIGNFRELFGADIPLLEIALPIGISFYTFESLTYVIDVYRGIHKPLKNFWHYQTYILLFPKLIAGPIVRYNDIADQISNREKNYTPDVKLSGFLTFCIGLAKKVIIANTLGLQADAVYKLAPEQVDSAIAWVGALAFTFQIYFDFSGYSDMAIGLGKIMGFKLPENFNNPYISNSITEFWRRWHKTLGAWMKNYLYIPLGGNQGSNAKLYRNLIVVFLLSGFWHGSKWNYVVWGAYHGLFLVLERLFLGKVFQKAGKFISIPITFVIVMTGWVIFKNEDLGYGLTMVKKMYAFDFFDSKFAINNDFIFMSVLALIISFFAITHKTLQFQQKVYGENFSNSGKWLAVLGGIILFYVSLSYVSALDFNPFIYFRF